MARFDFEGISVRYDCFGGRAANDSHAGEGPPVLFMHGLGADRSQARAALGGLPELKSIVLDMPGHGETILNPARSVESQVGFGTYARLARALLDHLGIKSVIAGGISMGAGIAITLALQEPRLVDRLFLVRPAWLAKPARPHLDVIVLIETLAKKAALQGVDYNDQCLSEQLEMLKKQAAFQEIAMSNPGAAASVAETARRVWAGETAMIFRQLVDDQPIKRMSDLAQIACPAFVLGNSNDPLHPQDTALTLAAGLLQGRYAHVPSRYLEPESHQRAVDLHARNFMLPLDTTALLRRA